MPNNGNPTIFETPDLSRLEEFALAHRPELNSLFQQVFRENLFTNQAKIHPSSVMVRAAKVTDEFISFLHDPSISGKAHGMFLCHEGLSSQSLIGLCRVSWRYFSSISGVSWDELHVLNGYLGTMLDGFFVARENRILDEQESFRLVFQKELNRSTFEVQEARLAAQKATEASYRNIILAQEQERRRISRELHDGAGQALIGIHMSLENLLNDASNERHFDRERLEKAIVLAEQAIQETRALAYSLRPPVLDLLGIHLTVKQLCLDFSEQTKLNIIYSGMEFPLLADELAITLYRIVQEALTNIAKHARAKHAWVKLGHAENIIKLVITDDGQGFEPDNDTNGMGLIGMKERVRLLNGNLNITSRSGKFSRLEILLPLILKVSPVDFTE
ncbi:MAG TPA: sensor histidine kinase [Anaerolineales bacterium]